MHQIEIFICINKQKTTSSNDVDDENIYYTQIHNKIHEITQSECVIKRLLGKYTISQHLYQFPHKNFHKYDIFVFANIHRPMLSRRICMHSCNQSTLKTHFSFAWHENRSLRFAAECTAPKKWTFKWSPAKRPKARDELQEISYRCCMILSDVEP